MKKKSLKKEMTTIIAKVPKEDSVRYGILCLLEQTNKSADIASYIQKRVNKNKEFIDSVIRERDLRSKKG